MKSVTVIDYGLGNLFNLSMALREGGADVTLSDDPGAIQRADRLILPGVGAFGPGIDAFRARSLEAPLREFLRSERPLLGICLGMQFLMTASDEHGDHQGLDVIQGRVVKFDSMTAEGVVNKVPQVSWNSIDKNEASTTRWEDSVLQDLPDGAHMYFVHSYCVQTARPSDTTAYSAYGGQRYSAVVARDNVIGVQFHPERSAAAGLQLLSRFLTF